MGRVSLRAANCDAKRAASFLKASIPSMFAFLFIRWPPHSAFWSCGGYSPLYTRIISFAHAFSLHAFLYKDVQLRRINAHFEYDRSFIFLQRQIGRITLFFYEHTPKETILTQTHKTENAKCKTQKSWHPQTTAIRKEIDWRNMNTFFEKLGGHSTSNCRVAGRRKKTNDFSTLFFSLG